MQRTKKRMSGEKRRIHIRKVARKLFAKKGLGDTTLDSIAKKAGVSRALIIQHFDSKVKLYEDIVKHAETDHPIGEDIREPARAKNDLQFFEKYAGHIFYYLKEEENREVLKISLHSRLRGESFHKTFIDEREAILAKHASDYIQLRIKDGVFRNIDPLVAAHVLIASIDQLMLKRYETKELDHIEVNELVKTIATLFLNGIKK